ncbi:NHLP bacteriocin system secretion protein [Paradesulfitobacterium aromaticivorans]
MSTQIYRKVSLERLSSPEQLDSLMTVTSPRGWITLTAFGLIITAVIGWGIFGSLPTKIEAHGILLKSGGIHQIAAGSGGQITDIRVLPNHVVHKGEVIARIDQPDLVVLITTAQAQLQEMLKSGANQAKITEQQQNIKGLQDKLATSSQVVSSFDGRVLEVQAGIGDFVTPGQPVISIELSGAQIKDLEAVLYVPATQGKQIMPGMEVNLAPSSVQKEEYGLLLGRVTSVGEFPATAQGMMKTLGNENLVHQLSGMGAPLEVKVDIIPDSNTYSRYKWSTPSGPPLRLNSGTLASGSITIKKQRPIALVFPQFN